MSRAVIALLLAGCVASAAEPAPAPRFRVYDGADGGTEERGTLGPDGGITWTAVPRRRVEVCRRAADGSWLAPLGWDRCLNVVLRYWEEQRRRHEAETARLLRALRGRR